MKSNQIMITPELPIGTELYILKDNKITLCLVAAYKVYVTTYTEGDRSWYEQLFTRFINNKHKSIWKYNFTYEIKMEGEIIKFDLEKNKGDWFIARRRAYTSINELKTNI